MMSDVLQYRTSYYNRKYNFSTGRKLRANLDRHRTIYAVSYKPNKTILHTSVIVKALNYFQNK